MKQNQINEEPMRNDVMFSGDVPPVCYDGHTHTWISDGYQSPDEVCRLARKAGVGHLAITDHDAVPSLAECARLSRTHGLDIIPGGELCALIEDEDGDDIEHIGAHWVDPEEPELKKVLAYNQNQDFEGYCKAMFANLMKFGIDPSHEGPDRSWEMLKERWPHAISFGKQAVALTVAESDSGPDNVPEILAVYLGGHGERKAFVERREFIRPAPLEWVLYAVGRSGIATYNHPFYTRRSRACIERRIGLFGTLGGHAVEVLYPKHDRERQEWLFGLCQKNGLLPNAGSDRHNHWHSFLRGDPVLFHNLQRRCLEIHGHLTGSER